MADPSQIVMRAVNDSDIPTPSTGKQTLFVRLATNRFGRKTDAGLVYDIFPTPLFYVDVVNDLGADPLGVTDCTSLITAHMATTAAGTTIIYYFQQGVFKLCTAGTAITVNRHVSFIGQSVFDTILKINHATCDMFLVNEWYCTFERLHFDSNVTRTAGYMINDPDGYNYMQVVDCQINNYWSGIRVAGHLCSIDNVNMFDGGDRQHGTAATGAAAGAGLFIDCSASSAHDLYISGLLVSNAAKPTTFSGVRIIQCGSLLVDTCQLIQCDQAMEIAPTTGKVVPSVFCINTFFDNSATGLGLLGSGTGTIQRTKFVNCWFSSGTTGVKLNNANQIQGADFVNCDFYQNTNGIDATAFQDFTVRASRFSGNTAEAIITTASTNHSFSITDNFIGSGSGFGANAHGINIQAGAYKSYDIRNNRGLDTNTTPGITELGTVATPDLKNVENNLGALIRGVGVSLAAVFTSAGTAEQLAFQLRIPANAVSAGQVFRVKVWGLTAASGNPSFRIRIGGAGTLGGDTSAALIGPVTSAAGAVVVVEFYITVRVIGGSAVFIANGSALVGATNNLTVAATTTAGATNAAFFIDFCTTMSASTISLFQGLIEVL